MLSGVFAKKRSDSSETRKVVRSVGGAFFHCAKKKKSRVTQKKKKRVIFFSFERERERERNIRATAVYHVDNI